MGEGWGGIDELDEPDRTVKINKMLQFAQAPMAFTEE